MELNSFFIHPVNKFWPYCAVLGISWWALLLQVLSVSQTWKFIVTLVWLSCHGSKDEVREDSFSLNGQGALPRGENTWAGKFWEFLRIRLGQRPGRSWKCESSGKAWGSVREWWRTADRWRRARMWCWEVRPLECRSNINGASCSNADSD